MTVINANLINPFSLFVTSDNRIFVSNEQSTSRVDIWSLNNQTLISSILVNPRCYGLFVDIYETLYCSFESSHQVIAYSLTNRSQSSVTVAGVGSAGSSSLMLTNPYGVFVTTNRDLYVADCGNNRIQLFRYGQRNGTTVAGNGIGSIILYCPTSVTLDADGYLFITDFWNYRIIRSGPWGFRCVVGCSGSTGSASYQLNCAWTLSFDSYGNFYVVDPGNYRIQKFSLVSNQCGK